MTTIEDLLAAMRARDAVHCPHCKGEIDMTDGERLQGHVSYWGEEEPTALNCPKCEVEIYLQEHVKRTWTAGRTPQEASDA